MNLDLPSDYNVSDGEANNLVYLILKYAVNWQMRAADFAVVKIMQDGSIAGPRGIQKLVEDTCEYAWDHLIGEPDNVSVEQLIEHITPVLEEWYRLTTLEQRQDTGPVKS